MNLELLPSEKKQLSALKFPKIKDTYLREIFRVGIDDFLETPFVKEFISARNLDWKVWDVNMFSFGTVNMHVDGTLKEGSRFRSLIIFLDGAGELAHINDDNKIQWQDMSKYSVLLFNDSKPHAFVNKNKTICRAIVAEVEIQSGTSKPANAASGKQ